MTRQKRNDEMVKVTIEELPCVLSKYGVGRYRVRYQIHHAPILGLRYNHTQCP